MSRKNLNVSYTYGIPNRSIHLYDFKDKEKAVRIYGEYMLSRLQQIFKWHNLPESIPQRNLEQLLLTCGHCIIAKDGETQYALIGGFAGEPNPYYEPTKYIVANPALPHIKQEWTINEDCVLIRNDSCMTGVNPLLSRYLTLLVENDISFRLANINTRLSMLISAQDDRTYKSAVKYLKDLERGEQGIISSNAFFEGLKTENSQRGYSGTLKDLIEYHQYIRASMYNEMGLDANYNMKRSFINSSEFEANEDALFPLVDDMFEQRKEACILWNAMYGMDISVEFNSVWKQNESDRLLSIEKINAEIENLEADTRKKESEINDISTSSITENDISTSSITEDEIIETNEDESSSDTEEIIKNIEEPTEPMENPIIDIDVTVIEGDENVMDESGTESGEPEIERLVG